MSKLKYQNQDIRKRQLQKSIKVRERRKRLGNEGEICKEETE